jgi:hypothetical protein
MKSMEDYFVYELGKRRGQVIKTKKITSMKTTIKQGISGMNITFSELLSEKVIKKWGDGKTT